MYIKSQMRKHRLSFVLSWAWALCGFLFFTALVDQFFTPAVLDQFAGDATIIRPLFWGSCVAYFLVAWLMISERRLPYSNNLEVMCSTVIVIACLLLVFLAAVREFYSGTYLVFFTVFQMLWFGIEVFFRNNYTRYQFALLPTDITVDPADFPGLRVVFPDPSAGEFPDRDFDAVVVDFNKELDRHWLASLAHCQNMGIPILPLNVFLENAWGRIPVELIKTFRLFDFPGPRVYLLLKPFVERLAAAIGFLVLSPIMLATAVLVGATSRGPILFRQQRVGLGGKPFAIYKFRTMRIEDDSLLTPVGGVLRRYHLDELPQLLNVLKGEMALVGPRPETVELTAEYGQAIEYYHLRTMMRPGVTSWALIHQGNVSGIEATKIKLSYDLYYFKHASPFLDFYIILKTLWVMAIGIEKLGAPDNLRVFARRGDNR